MRFPKLYVAIAILAALLAACACQSAHHPAPLLSPKQSAPPAVATIPLADAPASENRVSPAKQVALPAGQTSTVPSVDPVADLIAKVEKEYLAGQDNYKAGHLEAARQNFDRAFDLLLSSNLEINSDPRLENEF